MKMQMKMLLNCNVELMQRCLVERKITSEMLANSFVWVASSRGHQYWHNWAYKLDKGVEPSNAFWIWYARTMRKGMKK